MSSRVQFHFKQRVTEAELNLAFQLLEQADRDLASDLGVYGVIAGAAPSQHEPVADLSIDLTAPARAYDRLGQRIFFGTDQTVDCSVDLVGIPTAVSAPARARWLGVFLRFDRKLSDPRTDGNAQQVFFRQDESFELVVRQAADAPGGAERRVALQDDELLVCDVRLQYAQGQILNEHIDLSRRQAFIFAQGESVAVATDAWRLLEPVLSTAQAALDAVDAELAGHFSGESRRHPAEHIDFSPSGFVGSGDVQAALTELIQKLSTNQDTTPGARLIGADNIPGSPHAIPASNVNTQLAQLLNLINNHSGALANAHDASAIGAAPHAHITSRSVQAQLQEIVADLRSTSLSRGSTLVGSPDVSGSPHSLSAGTLLSQLQALLEALNQHVAGADHDARYYRQGLQVGDADTLDGKHATSFATIGHQHDDRYLRQAYFNSRVVPAGTLESFTTLEEKPDLVTLAYNRLDLNGLPEATTFIIGPNTPDLWCWVTKLGEEGEDKRYEVVVFNRTTSDLFIGVAAYQRD